MSKKHINKDLLEKWNRFIGELKPKEVYDTSTRTEERDPNSTMTKSSFPKWSIRDEYYFRFNRQERRELDRYFKKRYKHDND